jgi:predicted enzyme related to lactoylglutathione lyase
MRTAGASRFDAGRSDGIAETLARVPAAGGTVVLPKTEIGPHGFIAHILDTEGNRIGLHSLHG